MSERATDHTTSTSASNLLGAAELKHYLRVVRREWRLALLCVAVCLTVGIIYIVRTPREYMATARVLVLKSGQQPLKVAETDVGSHGVDSEQFSTYAAILSSPRIVQRAIDEVGLAHLPTLNEASKSGKTPTQAAIDALRVSQPDRTASVLRIDYQALSKAEAVRMVDALVTAFEDFLAESYQSNNIRVVKLITEARNVMSEELDQLEKQYLEIRQKNTVLAPDASGRSFITRRLDQWDQAINNAMVRAVQLQAQLELGQDLRSEGVGLAGIAYALGQLSGDPTQSLAINASTTRNSSMASDYVRQLINQQQELANQFGADYSKVRDIEEQIRNVQQVAVEARRSIEKVEVDDLIHSIESALTSVEELQKEYRQEFNSDLERAQQILVDQAMEENLRDKLDRQQRLFNTIVDQLKQAQLIGEYSGVVTQTIEPPHALRKAVRPRVMLTLFLALMSGGVFGVMAALIVDMMDSRIRSIQELRSLIGTRILGVIPRMSRADLANGEPGLIVQNQSSSLLAESYRALRTSLEFVRRDLDARVVMVCSPSPGNGKSTVTSNLAIGLAQAGRRVLLIDCDLRNPTQNRIFGLDLEPGFSQVLRDGLDWRTAIQTTPTENLHVLTTGGMVENPSELLMSERFRDVLAELSGEYDRILIDTSPLLYVSDPSIIAPATDGVLLVVRPSELRRPEAQRVAEILQMAGSPVLGAVVNADMTEGAEFQRVGRYYGRYSYGASRTESETPTRPASDANRPADIEVPPTFANGSPGTQPTANGDGRHD